MKVVTCPFCKEEINAGSLICRHCRERIAWSREEKVIAAVTSKFQSADFPINLPPVSYCEMWCAIHNPDEREGSYECVGDCQIAAIAGEIAGKLQSELLSMIAKAALRGGEIDPVELEQEVRLAFSRRDVP